MRGRIALQKHCVRNYPGRCFRFAKLWECARVLASLCRAVVSAVLSGFCCGAKRSCAEDSARYRCGFAFAAARIFRARSTTISDVTCFMQA
jgi:hypothetical protein